MEVVGINLSRRPPNSSLKKIISNSILETISDDINNLDFLLLLDANNTFAVEAINKSQFKGKVVSLLHDVLPLKHPQWYEFKNRPNYLKEFMFYLMIMDKYSQTIITPSFENLYDCQRFLPKGLAHKIKVIPYGTFWENDFLHSNKNHNLQKKIICVNTIEPKKGHGDILDAFDILVKKDRNFILYLVGKEGWNSRHTVERVITNPNYKKNLYWFKDLDDSQVLNLYKQCSIAVNASYAEGFGLTIEEGLARGMKVICRDLPVFRERPHRNLYYFSGGGEELVKKIEFVFSQNCEDYQNIRSMENFTHELLAFLFE